MNIGVMKKSFSINGIVIIIINTYKTFRTVQMILIF